MLHVVRPLEYGLFTLYDETVAEDLPEHDPNEQVVLCHGSTLMVSAQIYVDGDVTIQICVDQPCDLGPTPVSLGAGLLEVKGGRVRLTTAGWSDDDLLDVPPGTYDVVVHGDAAENAAAVSVSLTRLQNA